MSILPEDSERFADELDRAAMISDSHNAACIAEAQHAAKPEQAMVADESGKMVWPIVDCVECGTAIPEGRLAHGKIRCVDCQQEIEHARR